MRASLRRWRVTIRRCDWGPRGGSMTVLKACCRFRKAVTAETAGFYNTVGFNDDTRAFLSIPARHDLARHIDCGFLAELVVEQRLEDWEAAELAIELAGPAGQAGLSLVRHAAVAGDRGPALSSRVRRPDYARDAQACGLVHLGSRCVSSRTSGGVHRRCDECR